MFNSRYTPSNAIKTFNLIPNAGDNNTEQLWKNNGGTQDTIESNAFQINVSNNGKEDKYLFDVYVSLISFPGERLLIEIFQKQSMSDFYRSVREALESKYNNLNGLKKLRIKEMKIPSFNDLSLFNPKKELKDNEELRYKNLQENDELCYHYFYSNAHVLVSVESQDLWLSCTIFLRSPDFTNYEAKFEIKVDINLNGNDLKLHIQKLAI